MSVQKIDKDAETLQKKIEKKDKTFNYSQNETSEIEIQLELMLVNHKN